MPRDPQQTLSLGVDREFRAGSETMASVPAGTDPADVYSGYSELLVQSALVRSEKHGNILGPRPRLDGPQTIERMCAHLRSVEGQRIVILAVDLDMQIEAIHEAMLKRSEADEWKIRHVAKIALLIDAPTVVVVETRPHEPTPAPKKRDQDLARALTKAVRAIGLDLVDYVILARSGYASLGGKISGTGQSRETRP
jgi:DNA repair protein RadC